MERGERLLGFNGIILPRRTISAFVYAPHAEEYERYGVRAPLVCEAYIGSAESERLTLTLDDNWLIGIQTAVYLVNAEPIIGENATVVNYGSVYIESRQHAYG
ncbi:MAG: hypothetical protein V8Q85_04010 [Christensenellales bacterium]